MRPARTTKLRIARRAHRHGWACVIGIRVVWRHAARGTRVVRWCSIAKNDKAPGSAGEPSMTEVNRGPRPHERGCQALVKRAWWVFVVGGLAMAAFGLLALLNPGVALFVLATSFAASVLVDGVSNIIGSLQNREKDGWWILLLMGLLGAAVGGYALFNPPLSIMAFILIVAFEAMVLGVLLVMLGHKVRKTTSREWLLYLAGALSMLFGILVIANPLTGSRTIVLLIASWSLAIGGPQGRLRPEGAEAGDCIELGLAPRDAAAEQAAAEERAFEAALAVHAAAAETGRFARRVKPWESAARTGPRTRLDRSVCNPPMLLRLMMNSRIATSGPAFGSRIF
jgi:uncharacterized membrane protein HdeD (DUF308 family)